MPSRGLKRISALARWVLWTLLAFWVLFAAAWGGLHGWIVPRIAQFRPQLEAQASRALGVPVRIGDVQARTEGLIPSFEVHDLTLLDAQGREALKLPLVIAALSPRSLWRMGFEQLYIERAQLEVRRTAQGRLQVAGLDLSGADTADGRAADWVFSQTELVLSKGVVRWVDEQRDAPPLTLSDVDLVIRNSPRRHALRLDATPEPDWGERFTLMGQFRQPLLSTRRGHWQEWSGTLYARFDRVDVARLRQHAELPVEVAGGRGALRVWTDVTRGRPVGATVDLALADLNVRLAPQLEPLALASVQGRVAGRTVPGGFEFSTTGLQFMTADGLRWPGGNVMVGYAQPDPRKPATGELRADRMDLAALSQIAHRVPLGPGVHRLLERHEPRGLVESLQATWQAPSGDTALPERYRVKAQLSGLSVVARDGLPGVRDLSAQAEFDQDGGRAVLGMQDGALDLPDVFEERELAMAQLNAELRWQVKGDKIAVQLPQLRFANADARGEVQLQWQTADPQKSGSHSRFPGVLDLNGTLSEANGARVYRYLPRTLPEETRQYVREAVSAGHIPKAQFRIRGDLHDVPFSHPRQGEFHISAQVRDATYAYVPRALQPAGEAPWPALVGLNGELLFEGPSMRVRGATARFAGHPELQVVKVEARIPDLMHTVVGVDASVRGPLAEALKLVAGSPLQRLTNHALDAATATGLADYQFKLSLPISQIDRSKVQGNVVFAGNEVRLSPQAPALSRVRGGVGFSETGFALNNVQARAMGADTRLEGGLRVLAGGEQTVQVRASGTATAEGLRQAAELGFVSRLAEHASGSAPYTLVLGYRRGQPEVLVQSTLQGLALNLPAPLNKPAETALPLRFENALLKEAAAAGPLRDQLQLELGRQVAVQYLRDVSGAQAQVLRGSLRVGGEAADTPALPDSGVTAYVQLPRVELDAWEDVLSRAGGAARVGSGPVAGADAAAQGYVPTRMAIQTRELVAQGRTLHNVVVGGSREGSLWRANLDATEGNGFIEYRPPAGAASGRVYARLSRLRLAQNSEREVEALLDEQPASIPALDIVVDDFELRGKRLGRVEIEAVNRAGDVSQREWRLNKFNVITPEAAFTASGRWASVPLAAGRPVRAGHDNRRTSLDFKLDIDDSGELLKRFAMPDVVRRGRGRVEGQIAWQGSPLSIDYPSLSGQVNLQIESGQFLKAEPGLAKLLGVLSLQSLPRRLTLDFRDVFSEGFAFDFVRGDARIEQGMATTNNLQMKGVNAAVLMEGRADIARETQDLKVVVVPEINAGTASLVATAINPAIGLGSFLAQLFLRRPLIEAATQEFHIDGTWADPKVAKVTSRPRPTEGGRPGDSP